MFKFDVLISENVVILLSYIYYLQFNILRAFQFAMCPNFKNLCAGQGHSLDGILMGDNIRWAFNK
jgi:hypothetical protein